MYEDSHEPMVRAQQSNGRSRDSMGLEWIGGTIDKFKSRSIDHINLLLSLALMDIQSQADS